jgi:hypothetical protein
MASGDTLAIFTPLANEQGVSSNYATLSVRNFHPILEFDTTTQETAMFTGVMPQNYANTTGVTVYLCGMSVATSGTMSWGVTFERMDSGTDLDSDSFATEQLTTATTVPGTSGQTLTLSVACAKGATAMDSVVAGDTFRLRVRRDVANDSAANDNQLLSVEIRET